MHIKADLIRTFATDVLRALGAPADSAARVAASLTMADRLGCHTHGTGLLPLYAKMIAAAALDPLAQPSVDSRAGSLARIDGHDSFGQLTGALAVRIGIETARDSGISAVGIRNGSHLGRLGEWAAMAASGEMLFLAFCNSGGGARNVAPFGAHERRLSTNPVAFGIPVFGSLPHHIIADFATSQVSGSVIREHLFSGKALDPEWATTANGEPLTNARDFIEGAGALLPLGGRVSGHKGYALAIIAEILGGIAGGMMAGEHDPEWFSNAALFLFVDPLKFLPRDELSRRIARLAAYLHQAGARLPGAGAYRREEEMPGDGITLPAHVCSALGQLAGELGLELPAALAEMTNAADGPGTARTW
jgi:uncharacterized oxidoreductase